MPFVNLPANLQAMFSTINDRLLKLESARFTLPNVATDPTVFKPGDAWLNTTTNVAKIVDKNGVIKTVTWS